MSRPADAERPSGSELSSESPFRGGPPPGEGDDDALILWMLGLTPTERLEVAQGFVDSVQALRNGRRA